MKRLSWLDCVTTASRTMDRVLEGLSSTGEDELDRMTIAASEAVLWAQISLALQRFAHAASAARCRRMLEGSVAA